jgi:adenosine deaminase
VGINIVQKEHGPLSMKYYNQQMAIIHYLKGLYPTVHIALHAGELIPDFVKPQDIKYHIHNAIFIGQAERIGHGTDIMYEDNASELANYMATHHIPVEINLTSNADILNVKGANHPIYFYLKHHVPIVLSTDDEGILRTNLTHEYYKAVMEYGIDYPTLKQFNRNTLTYSFLPGKSIWKDADNAVLVHECAVLDSNRCRIYQINNPKAKLQVKLEMELKRFEGKFEFK